MTWRLNIRALSLALLAIAIVGAMVYFLYQGMQADKAWRDFVGSTQHEITDAAAAIGAAEEALEVAQNAGVDASIVAPLITQVENSQNLLDELKKVLDYAEAPEELGSSFSASFLHDEDTDLKNLDLFSGLDVAGSNVVTPPRPYTLIARFSVVSEAMLEALQEMEQLEAIVKEATNEHLGSLQDSLALSSESLIYEVARGKVLEQYAVGRGATEADMVALRLALDDGQRLLVDQRGTDRNDAREVYRALRQVNKATEAITVAASALVALLGVDAQQMLDELTPEQLWQDQPVWVPTPAPLPETTPTIPIAPQPPPLPEEPDPVPLPEHPDPLPPLVDPETPGGEEDTVSDDGESP